jgi:hypothetical protein
MLHTEPNWSQWIFDLVRDLPGHLTPGQHSLCAPDFYPTELEIARQALGSNAAQPKCSDRAHRCREKNENRQVATPAIECQLVTSRRRREHVPLLLRAGGRSIAEKNFSGTHSLLPARV